MISRNTQDDPAFYDAVIRMGSDRTKMQDPRALKEMELEME